MKEYERRLLNHLQEDNSSNGKDPLQDVKNAMGEVAYVSGNPLTKTEITLNITTNFIDGAFIPVLPPALPANLQTKLPVYFFGLTDFYSGFPKSQNITPPVNDWILNAPGGLGIAPLGIFGYNLFFSINPNSQPGDLILWFTGTGAFFCEVNIHCSNVAYGTFLNSFVSDLSNNLKFRR